VTDLPAADPGAFARAAFGRGAAADGRARPDYPDAAAARLVEALAIRPGRTIVDVGRGTGND
jgi:hypothetical protein